jgi:hypothetical protein
MGRELPSPVGHPIATHLVRFPPRRPLVGDLELPQGLRIYEIGESHIAGVERDIMGVEYVRLYQLVKP